jgi:hypothetical protein
MCIRLLLKLISCPSLIQLVEQSGLNLLSGVLNLAPALRPVWMVTERNWCYSIVKRQRAYITPPENQFIRVVFPALYQAMLAKIVGISNGLRPDSSRATSSC